MLTEQGALKQDIFITTTWTPGPQRYTEPQRKQLQDSGSILLVASFPITSAGDKRSCPCPQRKLQSSIADFSLVFCELRSRKHGRNKENRIPYFYMRVLTPGGNAGPTDLTLPLRPLPRPQRTGQGLKDETTTKKTDLEQIMGGSRNTSPTLRSAITNQLYDQLLLNYQIN